ncbi:hypothetical protein ABVK25_004573 [Lepraria finkii]|uniref:Uncharacterized protein n=1 Tax=Lepraria finkii TaxID=1340010 RepID=A0ABR4BBN7_9LECA
MFMLLSSWIFSRINLGKEKQTGLRIKAIIAKMPRSSKTLDFFFPRAECLYKSEGDHQSWKDDVLSNFGQVTEPEDAEYPFIGIGRMMMTKIPIPHPERRANKFEKLNKRNARELLLAKSFDSLAKNAIVTIEKLVIHDFVIRKSRIHNPCMALLPQPTRQI